MRADNGYETSRQNISGKPAPSRQQREKGRLLKAEGWGGFPAFITPNFYSHRFGRDFLGTDVAAGRMRRLGEKGEKMRRNLPGLPHRN